MKTHTECAAYESRSKVCITSDRKAGDFRCTMNEQVTVQAYPHHCHVALRAPRNDGGRPEQ